jgi:hypothetical protein
MSGACSTNGSDKNVHVCMYENNTQDVKAEGCDCNTSKGNIVGVWTALKWTRFTDVCDSPAGREVISAVQGSSEPVAPRIHSFIHSFIQSFTL